MPLGSTTIPSVLLLVFVACLINPKFSWKCEVIGYLQQEKTYFLFRELIIAVPQNARYLEHHDSTSALEHVLILLASHVGHHPCYCPIVDPRWSFSSQLLSIPFVWHHLPHFKKVFSANGFSTYHFHQIASFLSSHADIIPNDISANHPRYVCVLANVLECATCNLSEPKFASNMVADIIGISMSLLEQLAKIKPPSEMLGDNDAMTMSGGVKNGVDVDLRRHILGLFDPNSRLLEYLVNAMVKCTLSTDDANLVGPSDVEMEVIGSICAFLHVMGNTFHLDGIMTTLAYHTEIVPALWNFIKHCHENQRWQSFSKCVSLWLADAPGWLLPVSIFCPIYKHMLETLDKIEFCEQKQPFSLESLKSLILILKEVLWELFWIIPSYISSTPTVLSNVLSLNKMSFENLKSRARIELAELLIQLQDWNNRCPFASASDFCREEISEHFVNQAILSNTRESEIIKIAPFLVPFDIRVKIFTFEVKFYDECDLEEKRIDDTGFRVFMENVTRDAFDVQYGLFKETVDHLLYPNPRSRLVHEQHLLYFRFLGILLGKAMYEGIKVALPFATFFLSKLKQKSTTLNDLFSLDPVSYEHLLQLKRYEGKLLDLELRFVTTNNENADQSEELLPGGRGMRVTDHNVTTYIHLIANHRLNYQIRSQSTHFLRGFQQLIPKEWIDMFNEHEVQFLISGSPKSLDIDDLRSNTNYAGGYHEGHQVIDMFWEVLASFSSYDQNKFLRFAIGCSRGPFRGFRHVVPKFSILRDCYLGMDEHIDRSPTSVTCLNQLKLPPYATKEMLRDKLLQAVRSAAGL
ncbi:E3 ubiquitin-protein ligase UPL6 isoform X2 [Triticum aestivum]|uniref:E3 ubiquitin-protein ligase UPL6 isoform X2 n=1 Tax=Triticum aestivum TaxID=4565 RepID=UPI001D01CC03|nr:E3 ubiquitin-protein ligase UPL6-like isoform X2 [Triticum aestivum]